MSHDPFVRDERSQVSRLGNGLAGFLRSDLFVSTALCFFIGAVCWGFADVEQVSVHALTAAEQGSQQSEVLVVLAGDGDRWRSAETLVQRGVAPRLLSTLIEPACQPGSGRSQECKTGVRNTVDEALVMRRILVQAHIRHASIVTSDYHILRAGAVFAIVFAGSGIQIEMVPAPSSKHSHLSLLLRELGMLGPSMGGAILGKFAPTLYEALMRQRYHSGNHGAAASCLISSQQALAS